MTKKLVVIGAGMASGRALEHLFETDAGAYDVTLFNAEPRGNYNRLMLSPVLSGEKTYEQIVTHDVRSLALIDDAKASPSHLPPCPVA